MTNGRLEDPHRQSPTVFISYSWDDDNHVRWVRELAERLVKNGVSVRLDQWHVQPGENIIQFMERSVAECDRVVIVCTSNLAKRAAKRIGGIGYEQQIVSAEIVAGNPVRKFIPLLREGTFEAGEQCAIPHHLSGIMAIDFRADDEADRSMERLLRAVFDQPLHRPPPLGEPPEFDAADDAEELEVEPEEVGVLPRFDTDGWELVSGEERNAEYPDTFHIPTAEERNSIEIGSYIKAAFEVATPVDEEFGGEPWGERMWIKVIGFDGPYIIGTWANMSLVADLVPPLRFGRPVAILPEHVISIRSLEEMTELTNDTDDNEDEPRI